MSGPRKEFYCLSVMRQGDRFVPTDGEWHDELPNYSTLAKYFEQHYVSMIGQVEIDGITYSATLLEPRDVEDSCYALVNRDGIPESRPTSLELLAGRLQAYISELFTRVAYGEGLSPI